MSLSFTRLLRLDLRHWAGSLLSSESPAKHLTYARARKGLDARHPPSLIGPSHPEASMAQKAGRNDVMYIRMYIHTWSQRPWLGYNPPLSARSSKEGIGSPALGSGKTFATKFLEPFYSRSFVQTALPPSHWGLRRLSNCQAQDSVSAPLWVSGLVRTRDRNVDSSPRSR